MHVQIQDSATSQEFTNLTPYISINTCIITDTLLKMIMI